MASCLGECLWETDRKLWRFGFQTLNSCEKILLQQFLFRPIHSFKQISRARREFASSLKRSSQHIREFRKYSMEIPEADPRKFQTLQKALD